MGKIITVSDPVCTEQETTRGPGGKAGPRRGSGPCLPSLHPACTHLSQLAVPRSSSPRTVTSRWTGRCLRRHTEERAVLGEGRGILFSSSRE